MLENDCAGFDRLAERSEPDRCADRVTRFDWAATALGPKSGWSSALRSTIDLMLSHGFPMALLWGPELIQVYNDAYRALIGDAHPAAFGQPARAPWPSTGRMNDPFVDKVLAGETLILRDEPFAIARNDRTCNAWFTACYAPVQEESRVAGVLVTMFETTPQHLEAKRREAVEAELRRKEFWLAAQKEAFQAAVNDAPLTVSLGILVRAVTREAEDGRRCAFYIAEQGGTRLRHVVGMPEGYARAVDGQPISPDTVANGLAIARGEPVFTPDVTIDPRWKHWVWLARDYGYRGCASFPIETAGGRPVGSLAFYFPQPHEVSAEDQATAAILTQAAAIILSRHQENARNQASRERQAFLLHLSDELRGETDPGRLAVLASRMLALRMGADRCWIGQVGESDCDAVRAQYHAPDLAPLSAEDGDALEQRWPQPAVVRDVAHAPLPAAWVARLADMSIGACIVLQVRGATNDAAWAFVVAMRDARDWTAEDVVLVEDAAGRIAVAIEHARAEARLREREADLARAQQTGRVGGVHVDVANGMRSRRSPEYLRLHGLPSDVAEGGYQDWIGRVHREDRAKTERALSDALNGSASSYASEYRIVRPSDGAVRWIEARADIERDIAGRPLRLFGVHVDVTDQKLAQKVVKESEERLRVAIEASGLGLWDWNLDTGAIHWSDQLFRMQGYAVGEVTPSYAMWFARVHPEDRANTEAVLHAAKTGNGEYAHEFRTLRPDGTIRWLSARGRFFYDGEGHPIRMLGALIDTTEQREMSEQLRGVVAELQHRVRNVLAIVRSVFTRTTEASADAEQAIEHFRGRLDALARTQVVATRTADGAVDLESLIRDELHAAGEGRGSNLSIDGPEISLMPKAAETIGLAVHELATNAVKFGALRAASGHLAIAWRVERQVANAPHLVLTWEEAGVPAVPLQPMRRGFGRELIEDALPFRFGAITKVEYRGGGIRCTIDMPLSPEPALAARAGDVV
jgi:PAS domain S-box-containing protein